MNLMTLMTLGDVESSCTKSELKQPSLSINSPNSPREKQKGVKVPLKTRKKNGFASRHARPQVALAPS